MIAAWMLYSVFVAGLLTLAALSLERATSALGRPRRWSWAGAMGASLALPLIGLLGVDLAGRGSALLPADAGLVGRAALASLVANDAVAVGSGPGIDAILLIAWILASAGLLVGFARSYLSIAGKRRGWRQVELGPRTVRLSDDFGPAVVGLRRSEIVLPRWAFELPSEQRELVLAHEAEHLRSGDVRLLMTARLATICLPWLLPLWWQLHRLRLAVEVDCDLRVLRGGIDRTRYGRLLLDVGRRRGTPFPAAALAERSSFLERRIRAMIDVTPRRRWMHAAIATAAALALVAVACESPTPAADERVDGATEEQPAAGGPLDEPRYVARDREPRLVNGDEVSRLLGDEYAAIREEDDRGGTVVAFIFVDEDGGASQVRVSESSGRDALDQAALRVARSMRFEPARMGDDAIGVWVQQRIDFQPEE